MKLNSSATPHLATYSFSILERIDVGETVWSCPVCRARITFSILERIDVGETTASMTILMSRSGPFSILERIDVGETLYQAETGRLELRFQYPRTDRRG